MVDYINGIPEDFDSNESYKDDNSYDFEKRDDMGLRELSADTDDVFYKNLRSTESLRRKYPR